ncbi:MAG: hypothetical protein EOO04_15955 [Chitinophagaceae bacterium]|nr:MAG: hypothetical protein EOO04_15955 [Chitinophagaceae bacterium]
MALSLQNKLRLQTGMNLLTISAPLDFEKTIDAKKAGISTGPTLKNYDQVHWFVKTKHDVDTNLPAFKKVLKEGVICWIYYPKGTSKMQTDLTRDTGWESLRATPGLKWLTLISFDDTWSTFSMRLETESDQKQKTDKTQRVIFDYIDPVKKIIRIPDDLQKALEENKEVADYFNKLAFSHRKEYVEWIVTAKREETRKKRVEGTIEKLQQNWKNPRNI